MPKQEILTELESVIERLIEQHAAAVKAIDALQEANAKQEAKIRALEQEAMRSRDEVARLRMSAAFCGEASDTSAARAQVNRLLREVDKCIALVSADI